MIPTWRERLPHNFSADALSWLVRSAMQSEIDDLRAALATARASERERCAKICDELEANPTACFQDYDGTKYDYYELGVLNASQAIRALKDAP